ncbi:MAG: hypothetical protein HKN22_07550 [Bacteroidia bacterium]|nr:hypothetical protein [Bacteroidia bacterium]
MKLSSFRSFVFIFLLLSGTSYAVEPDLKKHLEERQALFGRYADQIKKRTGIFGHQTRRDIRQANEILHRIVEKDNKIIDALEKMSEDRKSDYLNIGIEKQQDNVNNKRNISIIDQMKIQNDKLLKENDKLRRGRTISYMIAIITSIMAAMFLVFYAKAKLFK